MESLNKLPQFEAFPEVPESAHFNKEIISSIEPIIYRLKQMGFNEESIALTALTHIIGFQITYDDVPKNQSAGIWYEKGNEDYNYSLEKLHLYLSEKIKKPYQKLEIDEELIIS